MIAPTLQPARATRTRGRSARYLVLAVLAGLIAAIVVAVVVTSRGGFGIVSRSASPRHAAVRHLPPYWTVRRGQTLAQIAQQTGLSVGQLKAFNPGADLRRLAPGQRLSLRAQPPGPHPPPSPRYWTVRRGDTFWSIARKSGHAVAQLERLNPRLKPARLQPGDRARLRP
jgi:LysM repeat protein